MRDLVMNKNELLFQKAGALIRITPCHTNALRFELFFDGEVTEENFTLLPQQADGSADETENEARMTAGCLSVREGLSRNAPDVFRLSAG